MTAAMRLLSVGVHPVWYMDDGDVLIGAGDPPQADAWCCIADILLGDVAYKMLINLEAFEGVD